MVLQALEFSDCLLDSPHFREKLNTHEKELDQTSKVIKKLINEGKELINCAKRYATAQRQFAQTLSDFKFETIGSQQTDDEIIISKSLKTFGEIINQVEEARDTMLAKTNETFVNRLEEFRKNHIVSAKEERKRFEKTTKQYCSSMEKHLNMKVTKAQDGQMQEADAAVEMEKQHFHRESMAYVMKLQEVQERKKFEFVETILAFMYGWITFYHQGFDVGQDKKPYMTDLQGKLQKTRESFESTRDEASQLMTKMLERGVSTNKMKKRVSSLVAFAGLGLTPLVDNTKKCDHPPTSYGEAIKDYEPFRRDANTRASPIRSKNMADRGRGPPLKHPHAVQVTTKQSQDNSHTASKMFTRQGYLFSLEKKALGQQTWNKYFCSYQKETKIFSMIPYNQATNNAGKLNLTPDTMVLQSCVRRAADSIDRRFCFDVTADRATSKSVLTLQALSDQDRQEWLMAMDGKEPVYAQPVTGKESQESSLNEVGYVFVTKCIDAVESRGLSDQGLYRVNGVLSKVQRLLAVGLDNKKVDKLNLSDPNSEFDVKTISSAMKRYFRNLSEPLMTYSLYQKFIAAAKLENKQARISDITTVTHKLPPDNLKILKTLVKHLKNVAQCHEQNLMNVSNLSVCFGPTLLRHEEETVAAIMDIKFCNVVVEILVENYDSIFEKGKPNGSTGPTRPTHTPGKPALRPKSTPQKYAEESTYGKHRPNYRPNSVFSNSTPNSQHRETGYIPSNNNLSKNETNGPSISSSSTGSESTAHKMLYGPTRSPRQTSRSHRTDNKPMYMNTVPQEDRSPPMSQSYAGTPSAGLTPELASHGRSRLGHSVVHSLLRRGKNSKISRTKSATRSHSMSNKSSVPGPGAPLVRKRVRTLYSCEAENDSELSFEPNQVIYDVRESREPGWLEGTINGKTGLVPANYIEYLTS